MMMLVIHDDTRGYHIATLNRSTYVLRYILSNVCQRDYELRLGVLFLGERGKRTEGMTLGRERPHVSSELMTEQIFPLLTKNILGNMPPSGQRSQVRVIVICFADKDAKCVGCFYKSC